MSDAKLERGVLLCNCGGDERRPRVILHEEEGHLLGTCHRCGEAYEVRIESFGIGERR